MCAFLLDGCCRGERCAVVFLERSWSVVFDLIHDTHHLCKLDGWNKTQVVSKGALFSLLSSDYLVLMTTEQNKIVFFWLGVRS